MTLRPKLWICDLFNMIYMILYVNPWRLIIDKNSEEKKDSDALFFVSFGMKYTSYLSTDMFNSLSNGFFQSFLEDIPKSITKECENHF